MGHRASFVECSNLEKTAEFLARPCHAARAMSERLVGGARPVAPPLRPRKLVDDEEAVLATPFVLRLVGVMWWSTQHEFELRHSSRPEVLC